jgi:hypothetical protein
MAARQTPGSPYHGKYKRRMSLNQPGPKRRRVCYYLDDNLAAWLAIWSGSVGVSRSHAVETWLKRMRQLEDPDGEYSPLAPECPPETKTPKVPKRREPSESDTHEAFDRLNCFHPAARSFQAPRAWTPAKPAQLKPGHNEYGLMPI